MMTPAQRVRSILTELREAAEDPSTPIERFAQLVKARDRLFLDAGQRALLADAPAPFARRSSGWDADTSAQVEGTFATLEAMFVDESSVPARTDTLRSWVISLDELLVLPRDMQQASLGAVVALLRDLQEENLEERQVVPDAAIVGLLSQISQWSRRHQPGWVNGLSRDATPDGQDWLADAEVFLEKIKLQMALKGADKEDEGEDDSARIPAKKKAPVPVSSGAASAKAPSSARQADTKLRGSALRDAIVREVQAAGELTSRELLERLGVKKGALLSNLRKVVEAGRLRRTNPAPRARNQSYVPSDGEVSPNASGADTPPAPEDVSKAKRAKWQALGLGRACPSCGAAVGEWCRTSGGHPMSHKSHTARL